MPRPYGRETKKKVGEILTGSCRKTALEQLAQIPDEQLVGHLFSYFYHADELIKFRSIAAMGVLGSRIAKKNMEKARIVMRRIMWNLNDESGGIGWGSPEAMGEICSQSPKLAMEFKSILFSYLDPDGNYIEHEALQKGVLWGIGTFLESSPEDLSKRTKSLLSAFLHDSDPVKRGYAVRALVNANRFDCTLAPENIMADHYQIDLFSDWHFFAARISDMAQSCKNNKILS